MPYTREEENDEDFNPTEVCAGEDEDEEDDEEEYIDENNMAEGKMHN